MPDRKSGQKVYHKHDMRNLSTSRDMIKIQWKGGLRALVKFSFKMSTVRNNQSVINVIIFIFDAKIFKWPCWIKVKYNNM